MVLTSASWVYLVQPRYWWTRIHGPYEHITVEGMETGVEVIKALINEFVKEA